MKTTVGASEFLAALARQNQAVLLVRLTVGERARLYGLQHAERESHLPERRRPFALERAG